MSYIIRSKEAQDTFLMKDRLEAVKLADHLSKFYGKNFEVVEPANIPIAVRTEIKVSKFREALDSIEYEEPGDGMGEDAGFHKCFNLVNKAFEEVFGNETA